jgi:4-alpha-glucanotransferase
MLSTHDTTSWPAWWENEAGTVDESLFIRKCTERGIDYSLVKDRLFDFVRSRYGRLCWLKSVTSAGVLVSILGKRREELVDFIGMYKNTYKEKEKIWTHLGISGDVRDNCDPRVLARVLKFTLDSRSVFCIQTIIDYLGLSDMLKGDSYQYRINTPGTISAKNWSLTIPISLEDLIKHKVNKVIRSMIISSGRA